MWLRIEPLDVWLFRGSRPFAAGEVFRAASQFPPPPLALVGALRAAMIRHQGGDPEAFRGDEILGGATSLGQLRFRGPFLLNPEGGLVLPVPRDVLVEKEGGSFPTVLTVRRPAWPGLAMVPPCLPYQLVSTKSGLETLDELDAGGPAGLKGEGLTNYLRRTELADALHTEPVAYREPRLGIKLQAGRTVATGYIYTVEFIRMAEGAAFLLEVTCRGGEAAALLPPQGFLALGGEARGAYFQQVVVEELPPPLAPTDWEDHCQEIQEALVGQRGFFFYLLTPAIFARGWLPDGVQERDGAYFWRVPGTSLTARLVAAAVGKAESVSGWNLLTQSPRPLYKTVPAGSVYFFETNEPIAANAASVLLKDWHWQSLMTEQPFYAAAGFGLAAVGCWDSEEVA